MINLLPPKYKAKKLNVKQILFIILFIVIILGLIVTYLNLLFKIKRKQAKLNLVTNKLNELNPQFKEVNELETKITKLKTAIKEKQDLVDTQITWDLLLYKLGKIVPQKSWISEFTIADSNQFQLAGYTRERRKLSLLVNGLQSSVFFKEISIVAIEEKKLVNENYNVKQLVYYRVVGKIADSK
ncbi:PilN domain-containing protein [Halanaerobaculum tunisiense]